MKDIVSIFYPFLEILNLETAIVLIHLLGSLYLSVALFTMASYKYSNPVIVIAVVLKRFDTYLYDLNLMSNIKDGFLELTIEEKKQLRATISDDYSRDKAKNRVASSFAGAIKVIKFLLLLVGVGLYLACLWNQVYFPFIWLVPVVGGGSFILQFLLVGLCKLITGREPLEPECALSLLNSKTSTEKYHFDLKN
ncbi:conserved membrane hypothetical protein [Vibrio crassostreae]|uniref:hypothetical protein n=1 Tax=Vibrio TaxID=662 RepID=UPI0005DE1887|nr:hypothetical protein [Vibrio crassostreae]TDW03013.1 hypothetical protein EDB45_12832 [Vibrio crassostreae]CAK1789275.1 conserved membrane hypothetical protein [Vibrio crassostreae]CAK1920010.1 conserved membrane hypothetical protein [Vibrio crassostreae]CAK1930313.1 conserved membrane hypothetical protein [Vibrio crassostreae]CAK1936688.1 conserved membrane hypothetical protein [Vibrio crassostreae]